MADHVETSPGLETRSGLETRERILQAAADLFADKGFHGTSLREIADSVGIRTPSLFYHFKNKDELYAQVLGAMFGDINDLLHRAFSIEGSYAERVENLVSLYARHVARHQNHAIMLFREMLDNSANLEQTSRRHILPLLDALVEFIREGQRAGEFREIDPLHFVLSCVGMTVYYYTAAPIIAPIITPLGKDAFLGEEAVAERTEHLLEIVRRSLLTGG